MAGRNASKLRIGMFGKSFQDMTILANLISGQNDSTCYQIPPTELLQVVQGTWKQTPFVIYKTRDKLSIDSIKDELKQCVANCHPGPNVLLLVIDPNFNELDCEKLEYTLGFFDKDAFEFSMMLTTQSGTCLNPFAESIMKKCKKWQQIIVLDEQISPSYNIEGMMHEVEDIISQNRGQHLSLSRTEEFSETPEDSSQRRQVQSLLQTPIHEEMSNLNMPPQFDRSNKPPLAKFALTLDPKLKQRLENNFLTHEQKMEPMRRRSMSVADLRTLHINNAESYSVTCRETEVAPQNTALLNIVLCGRFDHLKTMSVKAILGQTVVFSSASNVNGEVGGKTVSMLCLAALWGKSTDEAKKDVYKAISTCHPTGVHAFALVLPIGPTSIEDKLELEMLQNACGPHINSLTLVLFIVDSGIVDSDYVQYNSEIQSLCRKCEGRYFIFDVNDKTHIPELLGMVENMSRNKSFTKDEFPKPPVNMLTRQRSLMIAKSIRTPNEMRKSQSLERQSIQNKENTDQTESQEQSESLERFEDDSEPLRVVMVGKTGCGKSATGNTILGRDVFSSKTAQTSVTRSCRKAEGSVAGRRIEIVDTPGLFDTALSNSQVQQELVNCISLLAPGPHAFLMLLQIGRFTQEERETVELLKDFFGLRSKDFILVVLTRGDELKNTTIENYLGEGSFVRTVINECGGRYHVLNNNSDDRKQVTELIHKIESMVNLNKGNYYTSEMFKEAEHAIEKEKARILKEKQPEITRQEQEVELKYIQQLKGLQKEKLVRQNFENEIQNKAKQLRDSEDKCKKEQEKWKREQERREEEEANRKLEDDLKRKRFKIKRDNLQRQMESEEKKNALPEMMMMSVAMEELRKDIESWESERREWWERRHQEAIQRQLSEEEERNKLLRQYKEEQLQYEQDNFRYAAKHQDGERQWRQQEEQLMERFRNELDRIKRKHEADARRQAAESNEFQRKYAQDLMLELQKRDTEIARLKGNEQFSNKVMLHEIKKDRTYRDNFTWLKKRHDHEMKALHRRYYGNDRDPRLHQEMKQLQKRHEEEIQLWIRDRVDRAVDTRACSIQ